LQITLDPDKKGRPMLWIVCINNSFNALPKLHSA